MAFQYRRAMFPSLRRRLLGCACLLAALTPAWAPAQTPASPPATRPAAQEPPDTLRTGLALAADGLLSSLRAGAPATDLIPSARALADLAIAHARPGRDDEAIVRVASTYRLVKTLSELSGEPAPARAILLDHPALARSLMLAMQPEDQPDRVLAVLARIHAQRPKLFEDPAFANAIVAACLVYDQPPGHPTLGRTAIPILDRSDSPSARRAEPIIMPAAPTIDPLAVLDHLHAHRQKSVFPLDKLPVELLVHVVDARVTPQEQSWAAKAYAGNRAPGMLYDTITYDTAAFKYNAPKKIFKEPGGYTLANIKKVGGVCAEQALFSSEVGKAIGVPSAFVTTRGSTVGHAYVGYLKQQGKDLVWDFSQGRDGEYDDLRGEVRHPQTARVVDTGTLGLTAIWAAGTPAERDLTRALTILAVRVGELVGGGQEYPPAPPEGLRPAVPATGFRPASVKTQMDLLREGLARNWAYEPAWRVAMSAASAGVLDADERTLWMNAALSQCARSAPDFALSVASAMIAPSSASEQSPKWDALAQQFTRRPDLVAKIRFRQAEAWERADQPAKAWAGYKDVIVRYPNDGTVIVDALLKAEQLLEANNKTDGALELYKDAFRRISKPGRLSTQSMMQSNYFRVGTRYAQLLNEAGKKNDAERVLIQIGMEDRSHRE